MKHSRFTRKTIIAAMSISIAGSMVVSPSLTMSAFAAEDDRPVEANVSDAEHYTLGYPNYRMANPGDTVDISITETSYTDDLPDGVKFTLDEGKYNNGIPEGMSIDESTGDVSFNVPEDFWAPETAYIKVEFPDGSDRSFDVTIYPRDGEDDESQGEDNSQNQENDNADDANQVDEIQDDPNQVDEIQDDDNQQDEDLQDDDQSQDQEQNNEESVDDNKSEGDKENKEDSDTSQKEGKNKNSSGNGYQSQRQVQFGSFPQSSNNDGVKYTLIYPNGEKYSFSSAQEAKEFAANKKGEKSQSSKKVVIPQKTFNINGYKVSVYKSSDFKQ